MAAQVRLQHSNLEVSGSRPARHMTLLSKYLLTYPNLRGVMLVTAEVKTLLFVYNIILFITTPFVVIPEIEEKRMRYGKFSGLCINFTKGELIPLTPELSDPGYPVFLLQ